MNTYAAIILAAGKGTRMNSTTLNKVMLPLQGKPMLAYTVGHLKNAHINPIVIVIGFAKDGIQEYFKNDVLYALQDTLDGTAHAFACGLAKVDPKISHVISMYGDDSYVYTPELLKEMMNVHEKENADVTLFTVHVSNPTALGRIIRDDKGTICAIVEEKDATPDQKKITEINTGFYTFKREFVEQYITRITNDNNSHEYYLTDIIALAVEHNKKIASVCKKNFPWRGVNTREELQEAEEMLSL